MRDQAESLRVRMQNQNSAMNSRVITVMSGKGGVGKSNVSLNFSLALAQMGHRVLILDLDVGMGNIDILMGFTTDRTIVDVFEKDLPLVEVIKDSPYGISYIAGGTGLAKAIEFSEEKFEKFTRQFEALQEEYEYIIFDMGAGVSDVYLKWILSSDEIFIVTTPEPTSVMDAYSAIKYVHLREKGLPMRLLLNRAQDISSGEEVLNRLKGAAQSFLDKEIHILGMVQDDKSVGQSVSQQIPFLIGFPKGKASQSIQKIAQAYSQTSEKKDVNQSNHSFINRLRKLLFTER